MIENSLERIATALEAIAVTLREQVYSDTDNATDNMEAGPVGKTTKKKRGRPAKKAADAASEEKDAIDKLTRQRQEEKELQGGSDDDDASEDDEPVTKEQVRAVLVELSKYVGQSDARRLLVQVGEVNTLGDLPGNLYGKVYNEARKAIEEAKG